MSYFRSDTKHDWRIVFCRKHAENPPLPSKIIFSGAIYGFKITIGFVVIYLVLTVETIA